MSGHSKWSTIKNKKGKEDARRGKIFTKLARSIIVAARDGGADPEYNPSLKTAIEKAKAENMPNDNIERAIKKGSGDLGSNNYEEITYEGYGPEGIAFIVSCLTDNRNRTASEVRHAFDKFGGNLGQSGSVLFMFERKGLLLVDQTSLDEEQVIMDALEAGANDIQVEDEVYAITTSLEDFISVKDNLSAKGYKFLSADLDYIASNEMTIENKSSLDKMMKLIDLLEDNDDVQNVYHNLNIPDGYRME